MPGHITGIRNKVPVFFVIPSNWAHPAPVYYTPDQTTFTVNQMEKKTKTSRISLKGLQRILKRDRQKKGAGTVDSTSETGNSTGSSIPSSAINTGIAISVIEADRAIVPSPSVPESGDVQAIVQAPESEETPSHNQVFDIEIRERQLGPFSSSLFTLTCRASK